VLAEDEIVTEVLLPPAVAGTRGTYNKQLDRESWTHALASVAVVLQMDGATCRRALRRTLPGLFDERDVPVYAQYIDAATATGAALHTTTRWLNGVSVYATAEQAAALRALPFVRAVQPVRESIGRPIGDPRPAPIDADGGGGGGGSRSLDYGLSYDQIAQMNLLPLHDAGYAAAGVVIGILDTGFVWTHDAFNNPENPIDVIASYDFVNNDPDVGYEAGDDPGQHYHGTWILGTLASYLPGRLVGTAFGASYVLCKTEDITQETQQEEDNYVAGIEFIEANGGDVATASLIYIDWYTQQDLDGQTAVTTIAVNIATANGLHFCNAAGNMGHDDIPSTSHLGAPADAFQVISCGAVSSEGSITGFSSDGPTADGRVKPEVLARGADTATVSPGDDSSYDYVSGTSLSTPLVAGTVASLAGARPAWTVDQLRAFLLSTASDYLANGTYDPLYVRGYGIVNAALALAQDCNANGIPDDDDLAQGASNDCDQSGVPDECEPDFCPADLAPPFGTLNVFDFLAFQNAFGAGEPCADLAAPLGTLNVFDFLAYQTTFGGGCGL